MPMILGVLGSLLSVAHPCQNRLACWKKATAESHDVNQCPIVFKYTFLPVSTNMLSRKEMVDY